ncbi:iron-containing alcohol dehydrogenase [Enterococcus nangangensis]|uniref:iron-containing alcohol dehydrogenase n=1 Tax=Enterococcus nangangensis TaxID=2559926 RepID=UPI0010F53CD3|nr:iron-containing alcohol dehydrogenase [Enterococcus nangangensis]
MENFIFQAPTKVYFGKNQIQHLPKILREHGRKVLLVYGGGSIKHNGIYETIQSLLADEFQIVELAGVEPNPRVDTVRRGVALCRQHGVEVILAVGGGSTIDCAKAVAGGAFYEGDPWDFTQDGSVIKRALPLVTILTLAATGSEMNWGGVLTNLETKEKLGFRNPLLIPQASILDPTYTFSVPAYQTSAGSADILSHLMEQYFDRTSGTQILDYMAEGLMRTVIENLPVALAEPTNYEARGNLMWASSWALNSLIRSGKAGVWSCHPMEHELSAYYDITHGVGLAIITPRWMKHVLNGETLPYFVRYGKNVWHLTGSDEEIAHHAIQKTYEFFLSLNIPMTLPEVGIGSEKLQEMAQQAVKHSEISTKAFVPLQANDVFAIFEASLEPMVF